MSRPILNQISELAASVPDQSAVRADGREVIGIRFDSETSIVHLDLKELVPQLEEKPLRKAKIHGPGLD